jgi:hypothetical protein
MCAAVGYTGGQYGFGPALAEAWNGSTWSIERTQDPPEGYGVLMSVACAAAQDCFAVGWTPSTTTTLAERRGASGWTIVPTPNPEGGLGIAQLSGIACVSSSNCVAVGFYVNDSPKSRTLVERWNGTSWSIEPSPNPPHTQQASLGAVTCLSADDCIAVGYQVRHLVGTVLVERWNGSTWSVQDAPNPSGANISEFYGVGCADANDCLAVGYTQRRHGLSLAEHWDGSSWSILPPINPPSAVFANLLGASCAPGGACVATGFWSDGTPVGSKLLAGRWNGTTWTRQRPPYPEGGSNGDLSAVSCSASGACTAVGNYSDSSGDELTLAERYAK